MEVLVHILLHVYFAPFLKRNLGMFAIQKIVAIFVVNFKIRNVELIFQIWVSIHKSDVLEQIIEGPGNDSALFPGFTTRHRVGLTRARLTIGKDGAIIALDAVLNHRLGNHIKNVFLCCLLIKNF